MEQASSGGSTEVAPPSWTPQASQRHRSTAQNHPDFQDDLPPPREGGTRNAGSSYRRTPQKSIKLTQKFNDFVEKAWHVTELWSP